MLTDNMIDDNTARYFCIFAGKDINDYFNNINDNDKIVDSAERLIKRKSTIMSEAEGQSILGKIKSSLSKLKNNASEVAMNTVKNTTAKSTQAAIDTITSSANQQKLNDLASNAGNAAGQSVVQGAIDGYKANKETFDAMTKDAGANATQGAIDTVVKNNEQINKLASDAASNATQGAIDTAVANQDQIDALARSAGENAARGAVDELKSAATGAATAALPWVIGAGAVALGYKLWPKVKEMFKKSTRASASSNNSIAFVRFKDTDETDWQFYFSIDTMLWKLDNMSSGKDIPKNEIVDFMKTNFAKKFMTRCQEIIRRVLDNQLNTDMLERMTVTDKQSHNFIVNIITDFLRWFNLILNSIKTCHQACRKSKIWICCRVRTSQFDTSMLSTHVRYTD